MEALLPKLSIYRNEINFVVKSEGARILESYVDAPPTAYGPYARPLHVGCVIGAARVYSGCEGELFILHTRPGGAGYLACWRRR